MKVALCLFGIVGGSEGKGGRGSSAQTLKAGHKYYKKNLIDVNSHVDVFVHSWSTDQKDGINKLYSPKKAYFEEQIQFKIPAWVKGSPERKNNHYSKWNSAKKSVALKRQYEEEHGFKYDFVIISRFDIALRTPFIFDGFDREKFYAGNWCELLNSNGKDVFKGGRGQLYDFLKQGEDESFFKHTHKGYPYTDEGLLDLWFFANSEKMDKFTALYDHLDEYTKPGNCPNDSAGTISNHRLSLYHLRKLGLEDQIDFAYHMHDDFPLVRRRFLDCKK